MRIQRTYEPFGGRFFFVPMRIARGTKWISTSHTNEVDGQYRFSKTLVLRLGPLPFGIGFGHWQDTGITDLSEERARKNADAAKETAYAIHVAVNGPTDREMWESARQRVADQGMDPDEEMEIMQMLGLMR